MPEPSADANSQNPLVVQPAEPLPPAQVPIVFNPNQPDRETYMQLRKMAHEVGWIGKCFGSTEHAPIYFVGIVAILLVLTGCLSSYAAKDTASLDLWKVLAPLISGILGYLFGKKT